MKHLLPVELGTSVLSIRSGGETFAINEIYLAHVIEIDLIHPIPAVPEYVAGTCVFSNEIYTLIRCHSLINVADVQSHSKLVALLINHPALHRIGILGTDVMSEKVNRTTDWENVWIPEDLLTKRTDLVDGFLLRKLN